MSNREANIFRKPKPSPAKHKYVECIAMGMSNAQALKVCGKTKDSRLSIDPWVTQELATHEETMRQERVFTVQKAQEMYLDAFERSKILDQPGDMIRATKELTVLHGLNAAEKKEVTITGDLAVRHEEMKQMSDEELMQLTGQEKTTIEGEFERLENLDS